MSQKDKKILEIRCATYKDIPALLELYNKIYPDDPYTPEMLRGQINNFKEGQFVAVYEGELVGHCATFITDSRIVLKSHTWNEITGNGFAARHNPDGNILYGMEVTVDPDYRGLRIGQRLYNARKDLCMEYELKGIVFGGRLPGYGKRKKRFEGPEDYVQQVIARRVRDPVLNFQLSNDFEFECILENYNPYDQDSDTHAALMVWHNPLQPQEDEKAAKTLGKLQHAVRVATVNFQMREVQSEAEFEQQVEFFVDVASDYNADFITFPEFLTLPLLSMQKKKMRQEEAIRSLSSYTERYIEFMQEMAISYNINIIGGSHPTLSKDGEDLYNIAYVFLRDGAVHTQAKLHPTPNERYWWNIKGGNRLEAIETDCGPIGVLICYDAEFPETARYLADQGALITFVPFCTDERQSYLRVRYCSQARAVENQFYVVMSGIVGNMPHVENMDIGYGESCILTPCDFPFARDGVAATTTINSEMIAFADLQIDNLFLSRNTGSVQNFKDRRFDLYRMKWTRPKKRKPE